MESESDLSNDSICNLANDFIDNIFDNVQDAYFSILNKNKLHKLFDKYFHRRFVEKYEVLKTASKAKHWKYNILNKTDLLTLSHKEQIEANRMFENISKKVLENYELIIEKIRLKERKIVKIQSIWRGKLFRTIFSLILLNVRIERENRKLMQVQKKKRTNVTFKKEK